MNNGECVFIGTNNVPTQISGNRCKKINDNTGACTKCFDGYRLVGPNCVIDQDQDQG